MVDAARDQLRQVVRGMTARERIYADIKARASTRYPAISVARVVGEQDRELVQGSHAVSGAFTREAWEGYVRAAIREAAHNALPIERLGAENGGAYRPDAGGQPRAGAKRR